MQSESAKIEYTSLNHRKKHKYTCNESYPFISVVEAASFGFAGVTPDSGYTGRVPESDTAEDGSSDGGGTAVVGLAPGPIRTEGELVCIFRIVKHHNIDPPPFEVRRSQTMDKH